jgi:signal transduction histidine kinase
VTPVSSLDAWWDRAGLRTVLARDCALAVTLAVLTTAGLAALTGPLAAGLDVVLAPLQHGLLLGVAAAQTLVLGLRRVRPRTCLVLVAALQALLTATVADEAMVRGVAGLVAFYTAGTCLPLAPLVGWGAVALVVEIAGTPLAELALRPFLPAPPADPTGTALTVATWAVGAVSLVLVYAAAAAAGVAVATRRENVALLEARAAALEQERETETRRAVEAERLRMARELHDIAAHHLTGLLVQASAAERLVTRDDDAARRALREVRAQGKQALDNLRTVVGVLRHDDPAPGRASGPAPGPASAARSSAELGPLPGLGVLPDLVGDARGLGDRVALSITGAAYPLAPVADVTAYRVAQEALSNARQHAPGQAVEVDLVYGDEGVRLSVANAAPAEPETAGRRGFGLAGMHERAALVGGSLAAGPAPGPAWHVTLDLPRPGLGTALDDPSDGPR